MSHKCFVVDTSTLISAALIENGIPAKALDEVLDAGKLLVSDDVLEELEDVFSRKKFDKYSPLEERIEFLESLISQSEDIIITETITDCTDPKDNKFLELAVSGNADYIITSDKKHLVSMNPFRGIPILTPAQFLELATNRQNQ